MTRIDFPTLAAQALPHLPALLANQLPQGYRQGPEYTSCNPTRSDRHPGSFRINLHTGQWADFATGDRGGDAISLIAYLHHLSQAEAANRLQSWLGQDIALPTLSPAKAAKAAKVSEDTLSLCRRLWNECRPITHSLAEDYLRQRGITGTLPQTLRFHPSLWHSPSRHTYPALVAAVYQWPNRLTGLHRTWLTADGRKADITPNKMMLGQVKGAAVPLSSPTEQLIVAEGIETALSLRQSRPEPVWAALSTSGLLSLQLPPLPLASQLIIAADHDAAGIHAAEIAAQRWTDEGRTVYIALPPEGMDFNDLLQGGSHV